MMTKILGLLAGLAIAAVFWLMIQADNDRQRIEALEAQVGQLQQSVATLQTTSTQQATSTLTP
jgi:Spy/CpxP family protein refolding chaperone